MSLERVQTPARPSSAPPGKRPPATATGNILGQARRSELPGSGLRVAGQGQRRGGLQPDLVAPQRRLIASDRQPRLLGGAGFCIPAPLYGEVDGVLRSRSKNAINRTHLGSLFLARRSEFCLAWSSDFRSSRVLVRPLTQATMT